MSNVTQRFNIIKNRGTLTEATTLHGDKVTKQDKLFVQEFPVGMTVFTGFIPCIDYENHFIYEVPNNEKTIGLPAYMCTCGAIAVAVGYDAYKDDQSFAGMQFVCMFRNGMLDQETGKLLKRHADGSS